MPEILRRLAAVPDVAIFHAGGPLAWDITCEAAAADLEPGQWSGVIEAEDGFYLLLRKDTDLDAVAPDYFDALLQAAAESAEISQTRACAELDVSRFYERLLQARSSLSGGGAA